jgi:hypothetical protein
MIEEKSCSIPASQKTLQFLYKNHPKFETKDLLLVSKPPTVLAPRHAPRPYPIFGVNVSATPSVLTL